MFVSYEFIGIVGSPDDLTFQYQIEDDKFGKDVGKVTVISIAVGGAVEIATAVIHTYENRKLNVCNNLLKALRWHSSKHDYLLLDGLESIRNNCPPFTKYEDEFLNLIKN